jgi:hypothetical protein
MIYELRVYHCVPGRMPALLNAFTRLTLDAWARYGIRQVGFWTTLIGRSTSDLTYLLAWESLAAREEKWAAFEADAAWNAGMRQFLEGGPLITSLESQLLTPTSFSALK